MQAKNERQNMAWHCQDDGIEHSITEHHHETFTYIMYLDVFVCATPRYCELLKASN